ncbi:S8 family serine peptidase [Kocuria sp.]|uniref:S8 family peptidase n=1 Tax=Kocuria sp. TaxID=1871328 RepID=UPI0028111484|nr:S8 family serine peptidase [Kocuria sp.]
MIDPSRSRPTERRRAPAPPPETTGRWVVVFDADLPDPEPLLREAGLTRVATDGQALAGPEGLPADVDALVFPVLKVAVVTGDQERLARLQAPGQGAARVLSVAPELVHRVRAEVPGGWAEYLEGYRDGVVDLSDRLISRGAPEEEPSPTPQLPPWFRDDDASTWGLKAVQATTSPVSGAGVRVAVLDTGFDLGHPDFAGRNVTTQSFIPGESAQDGHGHGTHCIGTACGPLAPGEGRRYGVAHGAEVFAGKVLSNEGSGTDAQVLAGIEWALQNGCAVISMSLGADVTEVSPTYTAVGLRALEQGALIVAAAGNNADRVNGNFGFVGAPANSPYIMAVGALNQQLDVTFFSARSLPVRGGHVDVAAPGLQVYSSWPMPQRYDVISGTSMATPHVAGVAALWAEATGLRGRELWSSLVQESHRLLSPSADVGSGLTLAPQQ